MSCHYYVILDEIVQINSGFDAELGLDYIELRQASQNLDDIRIVGTKEELRKLATDILLVVNFAPAPGSREAGRRGQGGL